jgi:antitoxin (DNA-binding transcriptional repressor) of toxin-antitoxin stability system
MTQTVTVEELHNRIDELLARIKSQDDEIILSEGGTPLAQVRPIAHGPRPAARRVPGSAKGQFVVPDDFDAPLPDEIVDTFYQ